MTEEIGVPESELSAFRYGEQSEQMKRLLDSLIEQGKLEKSWRGKLKVGKVPLSGEDVADLNWRLGIDRPTPGADGR